MRNPLLALTLLVALTLLPGTIRAESANTASAGVSKPATVMETYAKSFVSIAARSTGEPILVVDYPWQEHAQASIEVRQVASDEFDDQVGKPLYFRAQLMKDTALVAVSRCLVACGEGRSDAEFTRQDIDFEILGDRNSFNSPAVCVACKTTYQATGGKTVSRAAFPLLEPWSVNKRKLYLDLPSGYFPQKCKVRVWMLRGHNIVWTTTIEWPGDSTVE
jgi:hypothetical protein